MNNISRIAIGSILILLIGYNINELSMVSVKFYPFNKYFSNEVVKYVYFTAIFLDSILVGIITWSFVLKQNFVKYKNKLLFIFMLISLGLFILLLFEFIHSTTFYYGEVRDKQGLPYSGINSGFVGSIILLSYSIITLIISRYKIKKGKLILIIPLCFIFIILWHYVFFAVLSDWIKLDI